MKLHPFWQAFPEFQSHLQKVFLYFEQVVEETPAMVKTDIEALFEPPGKMLRPAFLILSSSVGEKISPNLYSVAAAVELLHSASLVHDDIIDFSSKRRGQPSLHHKLGIRKAVLSGDFLLTRALQLSAAAHTEGIVEAVNNGVSKMCLSEIAQDSSFGELIIDRDTYFNRINGKTAELFALSFKIGAFLASADEKTVEKFYNIGKNIGIAFQIYDDVMDYRGKYCKTGKPIGNDLKEGIPTFPLILAIESGDPAIIRLCKSKFVKLHRRKIVDKIISGGFDEKAMDFAASYIKKCILQIEEIEFKGKELMISIIKELIKIYESA